MSGKKIYLVCPVRNATEEHKRLLDVYVSAMEFNTGDKVHYPPRDVDQANDDGAVRICRAHEKAMLEADEIHIFFDESSLGCHFDAGFAAACHFLRGTKLVAVGGLNRRPHKSFANYLRDIIWKQTENDRALDEQTQSLGALGQDSGDKFLELLDTIAQEDAAGLREAAKSYGDSWKCRGGVGAFMMLARKWDRMERRVRQKLWDIFAAIVLDTRREGVIDDVRDLRRYFLLVEAEMRARGFKSTHRDNEKGGEKNGQEGHHQAQAQADEGHQGRQELLINAQRP